MIYKLSKQGLCKPLHGKVLKVICFQIKVIQGGIKCHKAVLEY